jgi:hypothetical protein
VAGLSTPVELFLRPSHLDFRSRKLAGVFDHDSAGTRAGRIRPHQGGPRFYFPDCMDDPIVSCGRDQPAMDDFNMAVR